MPNYTRPFMTNAQIMALRPRAEETDDAEMIEEHEGTRTWDITLDGLTYRVETTAADEPLEPEAEAIPLALQDVNDDFVEDDLARVRALAVHDESDVSDFSVGHANGEFTMGRRAWLVLTDSEADDAMDACLEGYIDDSVLPEIPETYQSYFDREAYKRDNQGDRGSSLGAHDGNEYEVVDPMSGEMFYIYRTR